MNQSFIELEFNKYTKPPKPKNTRGRLLVVKVVDQKVQGSSSRCSRHLVLFCVHSALPQKVWELLQFSRSLGHPRFINKIEEKKEGNRERKKERKKGGLWTGLWTGLGTEIGLMHMQLHMH